LGSTVQQAYNVKAATIAAFGEREPDWTNFEPFYRGFKAAGYFIRLKIKDL
jgi:hypothetical protein